MNHNFNQPYLNWQMPEWFDVSDPLDRHAFSLGLSYKLNELESDVYADRDFSLAVEMLDAIGVKCDI